MFRIRCGRVTAHILQLSFLLFTPKPGKKRTRTTWRTCSAGRWKPCRRSVCHLIPASEREEEGAKGNEWTDRMLCMSIFLCVRGELTLCNSSKRQCCSYCFYSVPITNTETPGCSADETGAFILKLHHST